MTQELITTSAMLARAPEPADVRVPYGSAAEQFGDLHVPAADGGGPYPVAIVVHGGCWRALAGLDYMSHLAHELTRHGWAAWNLEFRRIDQPGGTWPGILEDVARGTDHVRELARSHPLDLSRIVTVGHSSGGHLALWVGGRHTLPPDGRGPRLRGEAPLPVGAVVALAAIVDLEEFHERRPRGCGDDIVPALLGGAPEGLPDRVALTSPAARLPLGVDQLLITGTEDHTVPAAHGRAYTQRARAAGDRVHFHVVSGAGHFEVVAPWAPGFRAVRTALEPVFGAKSHDR